MKTNFILLLIATVLGPALAQEVPALRQQMLYSEARATLIASGWQPISEGGDCQPRAGLTYCTAVFRNAQGRSLTIFRSALSNTDDVIRPWCLEDTPCRPPINPMAR